MAKKKNRQTTKRKATGRQKAKAAVKTPRNARKEPMVLERYDFKTQAAETAPEVEVVQTAETAPEAEAVQTAETAPEAEVVQTAETAPEAEVVPTAKLTLPAGLTEAETASETKAVSEAKAVSGRIDDKKHKETKPKGMLSAKMTGVAWGVVTLALMAVVWVAGYGIGQLIGKAISGVPSASQTTESTGAQDGTEEGQADGASDDETNNNSDGDDSDKNNSDDGDNDGGNGGTSGNAGASTGGQTVVPPTVTGKKLVALTFDDGPSAITTPRLLDILQQKQVKATFFVLGNMANRAPDVVRRAVAEGHEVGSHTATHLNLSKASAAAIREDAATMKQILTNILGQAPTLMRPPYGAGIRLATVQENVGLPMIIWTVDTLDWKSRDAAAVRTEAVSAAFDGAIILMHDIYGTTVDAVSGVIDDLKAQGYEFLTVSELAAARGVALQAGVAYGSFRP